MTESAWNIKERYLKNPAGDFSGGLMTAVVALPLCLAFGVASGLGAQAGLYGAIACGILAALFGGTPAQCSGPTGPMTVVAAAVYSGNPQHPELVFASCFLAGLIQIAMGFVKGGNLIHYMPYPVVSGFMTGIGAIIISIELAPLAGLKASGNVLDAIEALPELLRHHNMQAILISAITIAIIYIVPRFTKKVPAPLVALIFTTWLVQHQQWQVPLIGEIPSALPLPKLPAIDPTAIHLVAQSGLTLAVLGAIDSLLTSVVMDRVRGCRHDSNQELVGQGIGNMFASLIGGLPGAGATMRSMVNVKAGGTTYLSGALHGFFLLAVLLGLGTVAAKIPLATLAAILLTVGFSIMDWRVLKRLKEIPRSDAFVMLVVLALTIFVDLIIAVLAGVALASVLFVKQLADSGAASVGNFETLEELAKHTEHIPEKVRNSIFIYHLNGPLFFGEAKNLSSMVDKLSHARYIILRFNNVPLVDQTGALALENAILNWEAKGIKILFVGLQPHIKQSLKESDTIHNVDHDLCFEHLEEAIAAIDEIETAKLELESVRAAENG